MSDPYGYSPAPPANRPPAPYVEYGRPAQPQPHEYQPQYGYQGDPCAVCGTTHQAVVPQQYAPPMPYQPQQPAPPYSPPSQPGEHRSDRIVVEAPLSFTGSQKRIWRAMTWNNLRQTPWFPLALAPLAVLLILCAWMFVLCWYLTFGLLLVPYRMIRRSSRKQKVEAARHAEMMSRLQR